MRHLEIKTNPILYLGKGGSKSHGESLFWEKKRFASHVPTVKTLIWLTLRSGTPYCFVIYSWLVVCARGLKLIKRVKKIKKGFLFTERFIQLYYIHLFVLVLHFSAYFSIIVLSCICIIIPSLSSSYQLRWQASYLNVTMLCEPVL